MGRQMRAKGLSNMRKHGLSVSAGVAPLLLGLAFATPSMASPFSFNLVRSAGLPGGCAPNASAHVTDVSLALPCHV